MNVGPMELLVLVFWLGPAIAASVVANGKNRSWVGWLAIGLVFSWLGLVLAVVLPPGTERRASRWES